MGRNYAGKLIASAAVIDNLGTIVPILPTTETQARPLTKLAPAQQVEVWTKVVETAPNGKITARYVSTVVSNTIGEEKETRERKQRDAIDAMAMSDEFREAYNGFYDQLMLAKDEKWRRTTRQAAEKTLRTLMAFINL